jgi:hypothetical protein
VGSSNYYYYYLERIYDIYMKYIAHSALLSPGELLNISQRGMGVDERREEHKRTVQNRIIQK